jgi:hypothetical protein
MIPPVSSLAPGQGLFFAWVTLSEHKWVTSRERRRDLTILTYDDLLDSVAAMLYRNPVE